jgi:hypothetical protein
MSTPETGLTYEDRPITHGGMSTPETGLTYEDQGGESTEQGGTMASWRVQNRHNVRHDFSKVPKT